MDFNFASQQRELPNETSNFIRITRLRFYWFVIIAPISRQFSSDTAS